MRRHTRKLRKKATRRRYRKSGNPYARAFTRSAANIGKQFGKELVKDVAQKTIKKAVKGDGEENVMSFARGVMAPSFTSTPSPRTIAPPARQAFATVRRPLKQMR